VDLESCESLRGVLWCVWGWRVVGHLRRFCDAFEVELTACRLHGVDFVVRLRWIGELLVI
jgi:hypothetical protein